MQDALMKFDPAYGTERPYPSHAQQYRAYHGGVAWLVNPWTGERRSPIHVGSDPFGHLITAQMPDEKKLAPAPTKKAAAVTPMPDVLRPNHADAKRFVDGWLFHTQQRMTMGQPWTNDYIHDAAHMLLDWTNGPGTNATVPDGCSTDRRGRE